MITLYNYSMHLTLISFAPLQRSSNANLIRDFFSLINKLALLDDTGPLVGVATPAVVL